MSDTDLEQQLADSLRSHARDLLVEDRPFEPVHTVLGAGDDVLSGYADATAVRRPWRIGAVAAVIVVVAGVVGIIGRIGDGDVDVRSQALPGTPDDAFVPTWDAPDGWELSSLQWAPLTPVTLNGSLAGGTSAQLFGDPTDADTPDRALLVEVDGMGAFDDSEQTTVRGKPAYVAPDYWGDPDAMALDWSETADHHVRATYRGLSTAEVVAILDSMAVRPAGVDAGFDVPAGALPDGLALLADATAPPRSAAPTEVATTFGPHVLGEADAPPNINYKAIVRTVSPTGRFTPDYVTAWFMAGRDDDDVVRWWQPAQLEGEHTSPGTSLLTVGPDGRAVSVAIDPGAVARDGLGSPEDVAHDIAESVVPVTSERLSGMWDGLVALWASRDLVAAVPTSVGTVELRGRRSESVLCLRDGAAVSCWPAEHPNEESPPDGDNYGGQWAATVRTDDGDQLVAVSDKGPILMESQPSIFAHQANSYPEADTGEASGFWAAVLPTVWPPESLMVPVTDVAREAEACLNMLGGSPMHPEEARPQDEARIRAAGGGPVTMFLACRALTDGSWYKDVGP